MSDERVKLLTSEIKQRIAELKQIKAGYVTLPKFKVGLISQHKSIADQYTLQEFAALMMRIPGVKLEERIDSYWIKI